MVYFNSHPRAGGDHAATDKSPSRMNFNSHPRAGGDSRGKGGIRSAIISIRTPARGVTIKMAEIMGAFANFNSHPRAGGDSKNTQNSIQPFVHLRCFMRLLF